MRGIAESSLSMLSMITQAERAKRALALAAFAALLSVSSGCNGSSDNAAPAQAAECSVPVIVRLATAPDAALLADIGRTNALELEPLRAITSDLHAYVLRASDECSEAIARLRHDDRVRFVEIDARREAH
jgi:hypothetical protein